VLYCIALQSSAVQRRPGAEVAVAVKRLK